MVLANLIVVQIIFNEGIWNFSPLLLCRYNESFTKVNHLYKNQNTNAFLLVIFLNEILKLGFKA